MPKIKKIKKEKKIKKIKRELLQSPKGMHDILPKNQFLWDKVISAGREIAELYDFYKIDTPIVELAEVFEHPLGGSTDVVEKQMYVLKTKGDNRLVLRPEGTAGTMRSYLQHHLGYWSHPLKVYSYGPMFRHESPQAGRYRQFHQFNFETIGDSDSIYDAQIMFIFQRFLNILKIPDLKFQVNSIGCKVCRPNYRRKLQDYYRKLKELCKDCVYRLDASPLRILDCKKEDCRKYQSSAPSLLDNLCQSCNNHFRAVLEFLESVGLPYEPNPFLVRGFDYYNRTVFEIFSGTDGVAIAGGGRYDYLSELLGGRAMPGVGGSLGIERVIEIMKLQNLFSEKIKSKVFFIAMGDHAKKNSLAVAENLRKAGIKVAESWGKNSLRAQLGVADKIKAKLALIFGQKEAFEELIIVRDMISGFQETITLKKVVEEVKKRLK